MAVRHKPSGCPFKSRGLGMLFLAIYTRVKQWTDKIDEKLCESV